MRGGVRIAMSGAALALVLGGVGYGGYLLLGGDSGSEPTASEKAERRSGPLSPEEIRTTAEKFLAAWARGEGEQAAQLTTDPVAAGPVLRGYREEAKVSTAIITPGTPVEATVPFSVRATVTHEGTAKPWAYESRLTVVRGESTGKPRVTWAPSVVHPRLTPTTTLRTTASTAPPVRAVDHEGRSLHPEKYPSLGPILDTLRQKYGERAGGKPGVELVLDPNGDTGAPSTLLTLRDGTPGRLVTTLDARVQDAAERAVKWYGRASVVAIQPSTGAIRAVANNPSAGYNTAMLGTQAPGSTMKIVTAAMMLDRGLVDGPSSTVECPATVSWMGRTFQNLDRFVIDGGTFLDSFRRSCNTSFIKAVKPLHERGEAGTALGETARKYFGIGLDWQTGGVSEDGNVPESDGPETAASYIGQGKITMNALNMASISATVKSGAFRQPVLVPAALDGRELATAEPLPEEIASALRAMMRASAVSGTGQAAMASVSGNKGAKTGSAEVDGQGKSNSWFTGYAGNLAAAAVVQSGGRGGAAAGPVVAEVLRAG
ncbi:penicillin-binding transpeptidase domain-containing protein [Streptomyces sp. NPDC057638]|uniref:penicillin-binding transpeptidase domain-containing protein n=1 Tax=Streptomyces sp. NPDC057638 TaxID=3346190 RepID=UPI003674838B